MPIGAAGVPPTWNRIRFHAMSPHCTTAPQATVLAGEPLMHTRSTRCWRRAFCACGGGAGTPEWSTHNCCSTTAAAVGLHHAVPTRAGFSQVCTHRRERGRSVWQRIHAAACTDSTVFLMSCCTCSEGCLVLRVTSQQLRCLCFASASVEPDTAATNAHTFIAAVQATWEYWRSPTSQYCR